MANMVEQGKTPLLEPQKLEEIGYKIVAYPMTLLSAAVLAMQKTLAALKNGKQVTDLLDFSVLQETVGFNQYYEEEKQYADTKDFCADESYPVVDGI
jgi:2-methylisocitrate lyase-like PEP mutase family enzyme